MAVRCNRSDTELSLVNMGFVFLFLISTLCFQVTVSANVTTPNDIRASLADGTLLTLGQGLVRGFTQTIEAGRNVRTFHGLPFAAPPTDDLRLQRPQAASGWTGIREAGSHGDRCPQGPMFMGSNNTGMSEDCLYLSVYTPEHNRSHTSLPVMVWIHGGGMVGGAGSDYNGSSLAASGVVVVTINYRLGVFGFLTNWDSDLPGNFGHWDQIMALQWVKDNIDAFGGDPDKVTIFGQSAGSFSVSLLLHTRQSEGLFSRAILQSGSSISPPSVLTPLQYANKPRFVMFLYNKLDCDSILSRPASVAAIAPISSSEVLACFKNLTTDDIFSAGMAVYKDTGMFPDTVSGDDLVPRTPLADFLVGHVHNVDTIQGFCSDEVANYVHDDNNDGITETEFIDTLKDFVGSTANLNKIVSNVEKIFLRNITDAVQRRNILVQILSDIWYSSPTFIEADFLSKPTSKQPKNHFIYKFSHRLTNALTPKWMGAMHTCETPFLLSVSDPAIEPKPVLTPEEISLSQQLSMMWINFAKTGNPTPLGAGMNVSWPMYRVFTGNPEMLHVGDRLSVQAVDRRLSDQVYQTIVQYIRPFSEEHVAIIG